MSETTKLGGAGGEAAMSVLLVNQSTFPARFLKIDVDPQGEDKQTYVEKRIINAINKVNPKIRLRGVEYRDLNEMFPIVKSSESSYLALIVEDCVIQPEEIAQHYQPDVYIDTSGDSVIARKTQAYLFFSAVSEGGRDALYTQSIFPALVEFMRIYNSSPSYSIANHPIYFTHLINKHITAPSLVRRLASYVAMGFVYVEAFGEALIPEEVPNKLEPFCREYLQDSQSFELEVPEYSIDFRKRKLVVKTEKLLSGGYTQVNPIDNSLTFHGSSEKFYWAEVLPAVVIAVQSGYSVDCSSLKQYIEETEQQFSNNKKFDRFKVFVKYIEKISNAGGNYV